MDNINRDCWPTLDDFIFNNQAQKSLFILRKLSLNWTWWLWFPVEKHSHQVKMEYNRGINGGITKTSFTNLFDICIWGKMENTNRVGTTKVFFNFRTNFCYMLEGVSQKKRFQGLRFQNFLTYAKRVYHEHLERLKLSGRISSVRKSKNTVISKLDEFDVIRVIR